MLALTQPLANLRKDPLQYFCVVPRTFSEQVNTVLVVEKSPEYIFIVCYTLSRPNPGYVTRIQQFPSHTQEIIFHHQQ